MGTRWKFILAPFSDLFNSHRFFDFLGNLLALQDCLIEHVCQNILCRLDDLFSLRSTHINHSLKLYVCDARTNAIDRLE